jgi:hypothetical protein
MSDEINDGGPAFPSHGTMGEVTHEGMSLRDYFAGQALAGLLMTRESRFVEAEHAYEIADAMLRARKVTP